MVQTRSHGADAGASRKVAAARPARKRASQEEKGKTVRRADGSDDDEDEAKPSVMPNGQDTVSDGLVFELEKVHAFADAVDAFCVPKHVELEANARRTVKHLFEQQSQVAVFNALRSTRPESTDADAQGEVVGAVLQFEKRTGTKLHVKLGPSLDLLVDPQAFDAEMVWEQLNERNTALLPMLERSCERYVDEIKDMYLELEMHGEETQGETEGESDEDIEAKLDDESGTDSQASQEHTDLHEDEGGSSSESSSMERAGHAGNGTVEQPDPESADDDDDSVSNDEQPDDPEEWEAYQTVEDDFLKVKDLERFVKEAERLAEDGKLYDDEDAMSDIATDEDDAENESSAGMSDKGGDDDSDELDRSSIEDGGERPHDTPAARAYKYHDFFDQPRKGRSVQAVRAGHAEKEEAVFNPSDEKSEEAGKRSLFAEAAGVGTGGAVTSLEVQQERLKRKIEKLEKQKLGEKDWFLRGEINAKERPKNSLLNLELEYENVTKSTPVITEEFTGDLEDRIRRRIMDTAFDDVLPRIPEHELEANERKRKKRAAAPEVSQDKSKIGLGEMYEQEYLTSLEKRKNALTQSEADILKAALDAEENGKSEYMQVRELYKSVCMDLDALSSLHYAPKPSLAMDELKVRPNVAALYMEHAVPEAISDARLVAPGEVYSKAVQLAAEEELTKEERAARRSKNKKAKKKKTLKQEFVNLAVHGKQQEPSKAAQLQKLTSSKVGGIQVISETPGSGKGHKGNASSSQFFHELQDNVRQKIAKVKESTHAPA